MSSPNNPSAIENDPEIRQAKDSSEPPEHQTGSGNLVQDLSKDVDPQADKNSPDHPGRNPRLGDLQSQDKASKTHEPYQASSPSPPKADTVFSGYEDTNIGAVSRDPVVKTETEPLRDENTSVDPGQHSISPTLSAGAFAENDNSSSLETEEQNGKLEAVGDVPVKQASSVKLDHDDQQFPSDIKENSKDRPLAGLDSTNSDTGQQQLGNTSPPALADQSKSTATTPPTISPDTGNGTVQSKDTNGLDQASGNRRNQAVAAPTAVKGQHSQTTNSENATSRPSNNPNHSSDGGHDKYKAAASTPEGARSPVVGAPQSQIPRTGRSGGNYESSGWVFDLDNPPPLGP